MNYVSVAESLSTERIIELLKTEEQFASIKQQLEWFKRQVFGQKSEARPIPSHPNQLALGELLNQQEAPEVETEEIAYERKKRKKGVLPGVVDEHGLSFDSSVPVKEVSIPNPDLKGLVEGKDYKVITTKTSSTLAQKPSSYIVLRYVQQVVKLKETGDLVNTTIKPDNAFSGSYADVSFIANLLIDKSQYYLPLNRQYQRITASGIKISRSSLTNFFHRGCNLLEPIYNAQLKSIREGKIAWVDETPIKAGHNKIKKKMNLGYLWGIYGERDEVAFHYSASRATKVVGEVLGDTFSGVLQTDGYEAYNKYCSKLESIEHAECWSHTRRVFLKAEEVQPQLVNKALSFIAKAYQIETELKKINASDEQKVKIRGEQSKVIIDNFFEWLKGVFKEQVLLPTDLFTKAANYALKREDKLKVFLSNPKVAMDTNHLEQQIRPIAIGRKNWMFCWTEIGAKYLAIIHSLIATCKLHEVNTYQYLVDVLQRVSIHPQKDVSLLTPRLWKENFAEERLISPVDFEIN